MRTNNNPNEFHFSLALISLSAKGKVAIYLAIPVAAVLLAIAWCIAFG